MKLKFKKTPINKIKLFSIFLSYSLMLLIVVIDSKAVSAAIYGNAVAANLLSGYTATTNSGLITGTMTNMAAYNSSVSNAVSGGILYTRLSPGAYLTNTVSGYPEITTTVPDLVPANILSGKTILGVAGSMPNYSGGVHILAGNTVGDYDGEGYNSVYLQPPAGYYDGASWVRSRVPTLIASNVASGVNIMGIVGTATPVPITGLIAGSNILDSSHAFGGTTSITITRLSGTITLSGYGYDGSTWWSGNMKASYSIPVAKNGVNVGYLSSMYMANQENGGPNAQLLSSLNVAIVPGDVLTFTVAANNPPYMRLYISVGNTIIGTI